MIQQPFFSPKSATISNQVPLGPDHPVTRHDDHDIVLPVGRRGRPDIFSISQPSGLLQVADCLSKGYRHQLVPNPLLKLATLLVDRKVENLPLPLEILDKLLDTLNDHRCDRAAQLTVSVILLIQPVDKVNLTDIGIRATHAQQTQRGLVISSRYFYGGCHMNSLIQINSLIQASSHSPLSGPAGLKLLLFCQY